MALQITKVNAPQSKLKIKAPYSMDPIGVTIHETGNIATAMAEVSYMIGNDSSTGYHFAADDIRIVQGLPLNRNAFHSGDGSAGRGNRKTIAVETCYNWNGKTTTRNDSKYNPLYQKSVDNVVELTAQLFIQYPQWGSPKSGVNLFQHNDHKRKNCPQRLREEGKWADFVARVTKRYNELKNPAKPKEETKKMLILQNYRNANVYKTPSFDGAYVNTKSKNSSMNVTHYEYGQADKEGNTVWLLVDEGKTTEGYIHSNNFLSIRPDEVYQEKK